MEGIDNGMFCFEGLRATTKSFNLDSRYSDGNFNSALLRYEAAVLTTRPQLLVRRE
jgi:hypothetical protein